VLDVDLQPVDSPTIPKPKPPPPPPDQPDATPATPAATQPGATPSKADKPAFKPEELEQILAPIALYPDDLLTQVLMSSTYPIEVVQADRWAKSNKTLKGDAAAKALEGQKWDPSVKSMVNFPDVLAMMSDKLDWTQKLGDAFIGQQKEVMDTVQRLRTKAQAAGNLKSSTEQTVEVKQEAAVQTIVIQSNNPDVVYVPTYNPTVVYGGWPYPAYPPYPVYPAYYHPVATAAVSFGVGVALGAAWGYAWGHSNWGGGDVDINVDRNVNRNTNINRDNYRGNAGDRGNAGNRGTSGNRTWQHDASHRGSVPYRNQSTAQKFGGTSAGQAAQARDSYRGRSAQTGAANRSAGNLGGTASPGAGRANVGSANVGSARQESSRPSGGGGGGNSGGGGGAFNGVSGGGRQAATQSQRGQSSMNASRGGGGGRSAPARSGGGGGRGGGGRGGGGGRR
jgi:hypothetical protein